MSKVKVRTAQEDVTSDYDDTSAVYTYVGAGEDSPRVINLMGRQKFVRGEPTEITDPVILEKIDGMTTFVKGVVGQEDLHVIDEEGKAVADAAKKEAKAVDAQFKKKHGGE